MSRNFRYLSLILLLVAAMAEDRPVKAPKAATLNDVSLHPFTPGGETVAFRSSAERQLLDLANATRIQAGLSPLHLDDGLAEAARAHAAAMAAHDQLSHQLPGEPALPQRISANCKLHLDRAGENVAYAQTVEQAEDHLMQSPLHRENLLDPSYNVAGFAVVSEGPKLYVVQDFGHSLQTVSDNQAGDAIATSLARMRTEINLPGLRQLDGSPAQSTACAMAHADSMKTPTPDGRYIVRYTAMQPGDLPTGLSKVISDRSVNSFAAGSCYSKSASYPNGAYWVVLIFN